MSTSLLCSLKDTHTHVNAHSHSRAAKAGGMHIAYSYDPSPLKRLDTQAPRNHFIEARWAQLFVLPHPTDTFPKKNRYVNKATHGYDHTYQVLSGEAGIVMASVAQLLSVWNADLRKAFIEKAAWEGHRPGVN